MQNLVSNTAKTTNMMKAAAFALILMTSSITASAHAKEKKSNNSTIAPIEVTYLGQLNNQPVFQMNIDNHLSDELYLTLKDEDGNVLYGEKFTGKKISKKFQFSNTGETDLRVTVNLSSKNSRKTQSYQISNVTTLVKDVVVTEVR